MATPPIDSTSKPVSGAVYLNVADVAASLAFYTDLGFDLQETWQDPSGVLAWCRVDAGTQRVMLGQSNRLSASERATRPDYSDVVLYLYVDDAPEAFARLQRLGIEARHVGIQSYGLDEVWLRDPDGYHIVLASDASE